LADIKISNFLSRLIATILAVITPPLGIAIMMTSLLSLRIIFSKLCFDTNDFIPFDSIETACNLSLNNMAMSEDSKEIKEP
jgi:hypothetical protein